MALPVDASRFRAVLGGAPGLEDARAFLQSRLALFGLVGGAALVFIYGIRLVAHPRGANHLLLVPLGMLLGTWLRCRRGSMSWPSLARLDALLVPLVGTSLCALALSLSPRWSWDGSATPEPLGRALVFPLIMAVALAVVARAVVVPSHPRRTLAVSLAAAGATAIGVHVYNVTFPGGAAAEHPLFPSLAEAVWLALAVALSVMTSDVIYGLRETVREASRLGQYTLEEKIGSGGMGEVYRARHALLRRPVAVKLLPVERAGASALRRFEREAQLTALLTHPSTVVIYDYGHTEDGVFYYVMEYLDGVDLERLVAEEGPQPPARVADVLRQVCGSLAEAHGLGLVHRDVKPANVLLNRRGGRADVVKVVDFGLVKDLESGGATSLTADDTLTGTPLYLAPETIRSGAATDTRSDLYSVGGLAYFLLTGTPVFEGRNVVEVCGHHLHTPPVPPSSRLGRPLPATLEELVLSCLEKEPSRRPQTARALLERLEHLPDVGVWTQADACARWEERAARCDLPGPGPPEASSPDPAGRRP